MTCPTIPLPFFSRSNAPRVVAVFCAVFAAHIVYAAPRPKAAPMPRPRIRSNEAPAHLVWIEGEDAGTANNNRHGWYDSVRKTELSGNDWLSHFGDQPARATYSFKAPADGAYTFWIRANPQGNPVLKYKLDDGGVEQVGFSDPVQRINIAADGAPDLRFVAWIRVGNVELSAGRHSLTLEMASENRNHGGVDVMVFSKAPFTPNYALKPGERSGKADEGKWAFEPSKDPLEDGALLDLSYLNHRPAGKYGFIQRSDDGEHFVDGRGHPIRFWSGTAYLYRDGATVEEIAEVGRFYAKRGINLVRYHGNLAPKKGDEFSRPDPQAIDDIQRYIAGMKRAGVYVAVSPYWGSHTKRNPAWDVADPDHTHMSGLLFFDPKTQDAYLNWLKVLFTKDNPHTGIPLKDEPALAIFQIQNEDSLLFWTAQRIQGEARALLRKQYAAWLTRKYGSLDKAFAAWDGNGMDTDDIANGEVGLHIVWHLTRDTSNPGKAARLTDQLEFLSRTMRNWNQRVRIFLREEIGAPHLINAGNWKTADNVKLMDAERWSYTANEVPGVNKYYGVVHTGPKSGYAILQGDKYVPKSALMNPRAMPTNIKQVAGHPMIIPESQWVPPNRYQSEGPLAIAAYLSLTGVDSFFWFTLGDGFGPPFGKWQTGTPVQMGMFPAASLMFRNHYLQEGAPVVVEERSLEDIFSRRGTLIAADAGFDPLRDTGNLPRRSNVKDGVNPLAFLAGPVKVRYGGDAVHSAVSDQLDRLIDEKNGVVTGITNQVRLDYKKGVLLVNSPKARAAAGFLGDVSPITLGNVRIATRNKYTSVYIVSLDGEDLVESGHILVQAATTARPYGYKEKPVTWKKDKDRFEGFEITNLGSTPWNLEKNDLDILIQNRTVTTAYVLDANGYAIAKIDLAEVHGGRRLRFPENALYVVLR